MDRQSGTETARSGEMAQDAAHVVADLLQPVFDARLTDIALVVATKKSLIVAKNVVNPNTLLSKSKSIVNPSIQKHHGSQHQMLVTVYGRTAEQ